jgi:hypothetical protein
MLMMHVPRECEANRTFEGGRSCCWIGRLSKRMQACGFSPLSWETKACSSCTYTRPSAEGWAAARLPSASTYSVQFRGGATRVPSCTSADAITYGVLLLRQRQLAAPSPLRTHMMHGSMGKTPYSRAVAYKHTPRQHVPCTPSQCQHSVPGGTNSHRAGAQPLPGHQSDWRSLPSVYPWTPAGLSSCWRAQTGTLQRTHTVLG